MKVFHVITTINLGGAENHLIDLVKEQVGQGKTVIVSYLKGDHFWKKTLEEMGVTVYYLGCNNSDIFFKFFKLSGFIKQEDPDVVHSHMPPAELISRLALLVANKRYKWIISKHNDERFAPVPFERLLARLVAHRADKIICISLAVKKFMMINAKIPEAKLAQIYYSVDTEKFLKAEKAKDLELGHKFIVGTIARLVPQKSLDTLISAFAVFSQRNEQALLVIVGSGPLEGELKALAFSLGVGGKIIWTGKRQDIPSVMKTFSVFVLSSIYEGLGLVLLEAMASKVPIIASNVSAIPEVLDYGRCGILVEAKQVDQLVMALETLQTEDRRKELASLGFERATNFFSVKKMEKETESIYLS